MGRNGRHVYVLAKLGSWICTGGIFAEVPGQVQKLLCGYLYSAASKDIIK